MQTLAAFALLVAGPTVAQYCSSGHDTSSTGPTSNPTAAPVDGLVGPVIDAPGAKKDEFDMKRADVPASASQEHKMTDAEQLANLGELRNGHYWVWDPFGPTSVTMEEANDIQLKMIKGLPGVDLRVAAMQTLDNSEVEKIAPGSSGNPDNVKRVETVLSAQIFSRIFPCKDPLYTYDALLKAIGKFPEFCKTYTDGRDSDKICKLVLGASFAHFTQETGANAPSWTIADCKASGKGDEESWSYYDGKGPIPTTSQALYYTVELGYTPETITSPYEECEPNQHGMNTYFYPCSGKGSYFGRGGKQVSYNYNYGQLSETMTGSTFTYLDDPNQLITGWNIFGSAIWFAVTPQSPKPSMVWVLDGTWVPNDVDKAANNEPGFGATINIINGAVECNGQSERADNRVKALKSIAEFLQVDISEWGKLDCATSQQFGAGGAAVMNLFLRGQSPGTGCELTSDVTPFVALRPGDYKRCVDYYFRSHIWTEGKTKVADYGSAA